MPEDTTITAPVTEGQGNPEPSKENKDAAFWKSKHDGLSGYVKQLEEQLKTAKQEHVEIVTRLTGEKQTIVSEKEQFETSAKSLEEQLKGFQAQIRELEGKVTLTERQKAVRRTLSGVEDGVLKTDLLQQYDSNLLPNLELLDDTGLQEWVKNKVAYETGKLTDARRHSKSGTLPNPPSPTTPTGTTRSVSELLEEISRTPPGEKRETLKAELLLAAKPSSTE